MILEIYIYIILKENFLLLAPYEIIEIRLCSIITKLNQHLLSIWLLIALKTIDCIFLFLVCWVRNIMQVLVKKLQKQKGSTSSWIMRS